MFTLVQQYAFQWNERHAFYDVERLKLFQNPEGYFYLPPDPVDEQEEIADEDLDLVLAGRESGFQIE